MAEFPLDADPGDSARGPDGRTYRLGYDDLWRVDPLQKRPGDQPIPHVPADDPGRIAAEDAAAEAFNRRLKAEEAAEATARRAAVRAAAALAGDRLDLPATIFIDDGDHAAVVAEVPAHQREDGWTASRRIGFLELLAEKGSVEAAARGVGMTRQAVRKLWRRAPAFRAAYEEIMRDTVVQLAETAVERALHGSLQPVYSRGGELVGTRTVHHDRLLLYLLRVRDPLNYAPIDELERWKKHRVLDAAVTTSPPHRGGEALGALPGPLGSSPSQGACAGDGGGAGSSPRDPSHEGSAP